MEVRDMRNDSESLVTDRRRLASSSSEDEAFHTTRCDEPANQPDLVIIANGGRKNSRIKPETTQLEVDTPPRDAAPDPADRDSWDSRLDFLFSIIGFAVDLANVWRFPYLCYSHGGGAFLIPYFTMLVFGALPLFYMELLLGQYHRQGAITVWRIAPMFKGIGWCICIVTWLVSWYYNVIITWSFYFLVRSFTFTLPWTDDYIYISTNESLINSTSAFNWTNTSWSNVSTERVSKAAVFFEQEVLGIDRSSGIDDAVGPKWDIVVCSAIVFLLLFLALYKGIKVSGKVTWFTAMAPYAILAILLVRGLFLDGSVKGIYYYLTPDLSRLSDPTVWLDAAFQIFFSVGAGFGVHLAYASYNPFHNNCYVDCLITAGANSCASIFSGFVVFAYLGYMSVKLELPIEKVVNEGPGLVFIVYPEAIATLSWAPLWSCIFFFMLIMLGFDSAMGGFEAIITAISDNFRDQLAPYQHSRKILSGVVVFGAFLASTSCTTYGGYWVVKLMDYFAAGFALLSAALAECLIVSWVYGLDQFRADAKEMLGFEPGWYWRICWKIVSPMFIGSILLASIVTFAPLEVSTVSHGAYLYPGWASGVGWFLALISVVMIPLYAVGRLALWSGDARKRFAYGLTPEWHHAAITTGEAPVKRFSVRFDAVFILLWFVKQAKHWFSF